MQGARPFVLEAFQEEMLTDFFGGVRESLILVPKKNGKTTLIAAVALHHLFTVDDADCFIAASSRDQATILYDQARGFVRRSPGLDRHIKVKRGYRRLDAVRDDGKIRVLAADENTADGVLPTLALVDELHRHRSEALYGILADGLGPREGRMVTISTAGANVESPLGHHRRKGHEMDSFVRVGSKNTARSENGAWVMHEWCCDPEADLDDMEVVKAANPASWQTVPKLRERHDSPTTTPWQWARFAGGVWLEGEDPWINPVSWDDLADPDLGDPVGEVVLAVDLGVRHDTTGIAIVWQHGDQVAVRAVVLEPGEDGVKLAVVEERIRALCREHRVGQVVYDPWSFRRSAELLEADGIPVVEFPQSHERMSQASANLFRLIESGGLVHDGDPVLRAHVLAGVTKETERGWRLVKDPRNRRPIDALIAVAMGCQQFNAKPERSREAIFI